MDGTVTFATTRPSTATTYSPRSSDFSSTFSVTATNVISFLSKPSNSSSVSASDSPSKTPHVFFSSNMFANSPPSQVLQHEHGFPLVAFLVCGPVLRGNGHGACGVGCLTNELCTHCPASSSARPQLRHKMLLAGDSLFDYHGLACRKWIRIQSFRTAMTSAWSFHMNENSGREQIELVLHTALYLFFNNGIRVGTSKCTPAIGQDVSTCQVLVAMCTAHFFCKFKEREIFNDARNQRMSAWIMTDNFFWNSI